MGGAVKVKDTENRPDAMHQGAVPGGRVGVSTALLLLLSLLLFLLATSSAEARKLYRWVNEDGSVYYSDRVPPQESGRERAILDRQGITVDRVDEAKSREELILEARRQAELEELRRQQQRVIERQQAEDRILLRTFHAEEDIIMARDSKLAAIDVAIELQQLNIQRTKDRLASLQQQAANLERQGRAIPAEDEEDIARARQQLQAFYATLISREREKGEIFAQFDRDMGRFRELKNIQAPVGTSEQDRRRHTSLLETVFPCSRRHCDLIWETAERFARQHATTAMQVISDSIIMTAAPRRPEDISITISRIDRSGSSSNANSQDNESILFMDLQCSNSHSGQELCASEQVAEIRRQFNPTLAAASP